MMRLPAHQVAHLMLVGLPAGLAARAGGLFGAFIGLGALAGGWAIDRWGPGRLGVVGTVLLCLGMLGLLGSGPDPAALALVAVYILAGGIGRGFIGVNLTAFHARAFAGPALGRVAGLLDLGFGFGAFAGPYLVALSRDLTGSYAPGLATVLLAATVAGVCPLIAGATLRRPASSPQSP
jgi:MFS family permease